MNHHSEFLNLVADALTRIKEITLTELVSKINSGETLQLIDVREDAEWEKGHLHNAIHLSKGTIERDISNQIPDKATPLVLYCGGGYRSALATDAIQKMGYQNVWSLEGGFKAWYENKLPICDE